MSVNIIAAVAADGSIGRRGELIFSISADMRRFRELTTGHTVIMGRRTFESLPSGALPRRRNIVVTSQADFAAEGVETASSLNKALAMAAQGAGETFIIGGATIYEQTLPIADRLYLTEVAAVCPDADTFFPVFDMSAWQVDEAGEVTTDPKTDLDYRFITLSRKK